MVKLHRVFRRIHCPYKTNEILFVWLPGTKNPADLNSKSLPNLLKIINGDFWRHGPPAFTSETFPTSDMKVYGRYVGGSFHFDGLGLTDTDIHLTTCKNSTCMNTESGGMVAGKLTSHTQLLGSAGSTDGVFDTNQLMLADQNKGEPAEQLGITPDTGKPVQGRPAVGISEEPPQSVEPVAAKPAHNGQVQRKILQKFATISGYTRSLTNLVLCIKKDAHQVLLMLRIWWNVLRQSQELFPVKNCRQMLLTKVRGVLGTKKKNGPWTISDVPQDSHINLTSCKSRRPPSN